MARTKFILDDGTEVHIESLNGREDPREFIRFINSFLRDGSYLLIDKPVTLKKEKEWLRTQLQTQRKGEQLYLKALVDGRLVGDCFAKSGFGRNRGNVDLGIAVKREWRGRGIGHLLLRTLIERSERKWHPHNIYLHVIAANTRAKKLYESLGFRVVATLPQWFEYKGTYLDELVLILDKQRFRGVADNNPSLMASQGRGTGSLPVSRS
ncbi:MAG TPA: GNAT family N-acetyltransferase [Candidatus Thermoplasmatota archaeon]|nr:GNAT family N-acetyltransferase [Candidatus Thermoplasmatota archaeon]